MLLSSPCAIDNDQRKSSTATSLRSTKSMEVRVRKALGASARCVSVPLCRGDAYRGNDGVRSLYLLDCRSAMQS